MLNNKAAGHIAAFLTILVWGETFISTAVLLRQFTPVEILFIRFSLGWIALWIMRPARLKFQSVKKELLFALAGLSGVTLYFLLENIALTYTLASNVSVIVTTSPFFTALLAWRLLGEKRPSIMFMAGFLTALAGMALMAFNDSIPRLNPFGDMLALLAAIAWAFYSIFTRKLADFGHGVFVTTRRIFFYGLVFMLPFVCADKPSMELLRAAIQPISLFNLSFLGIGASALCFASWTFSLKKLGTVRASVYIYLVPVVTIIMASLVLHEPMTVQSVLGSALTICGLLMAQFQWPVWKKSGMLTQQKVDSGK